MTIVWAVTVVEEREGCVLQQIEKKCAGNKDHAAREKRYTEDKDKVSVSAFSYYLCDL